VMLPNPFSTVKKILGEKNSSNLQKMDLRKA
jgi:hypothetical protein